MNGKMEDERLLSMFGKPFSCCQVVLRFWRHLWQAGLQQESPYHPARAGGRSRQPRCVKWLWRVYETMLRSMFSLSSNFPKRFLKNHGPECITLSSFKIESHIFSFTKANICISCICECSYLHRLNYMYGVSAHAHKRMRFSIENTSQAGHCWDMDYFWLTKAREYRNWHGHCQQIHICPSLRFMLLNLLLHLICLVSFCQQKSVITMAHLLCHRWRLTCFISLPMLEVIPAMNLTQEQRNLFCSSVYKCRLNQGQISEHDRFVLKEGNVFIGFF